MDRRDLQTSIARAWVVANKLSLGETFSNGDSLSVDEDFRKAVLDLNSGYEDIFMLGLGKSHYNFLLSDHSFFQFSWNGRNDVRYAFYPNPFLGQDASQLIAYKKKRELLDAEFIQYDEFLQLLGDARGHGRIPVLRYENAPGQYKELIHPCSHFHIGLHGDDRWAVRRLLTPLAFTLIIFRNYYGNDWMKYSIGEEESQFSKMDEEFMLARNECRLLDVEHFSAIEERGFHIL